MNKGFVAFLSFGAGTTIGFIAANKMMKQKYEQLVQDEIDSVKAVFKRNAEKKGEGTVDEKPQKPTAEERQRYTNYARNLGYTEEKKPEPELIPHVISPEEFGELPEYDKVSLTYYADKTVTDETDHAMSPEDIEDAIGFESLEHFGEYEDDSVFVRNDRLKVDYEILLDQRTYADILREKPYLARN